MPDIIPPLKLPAPGVRDAYIYISGINRDLADQSVDCIGRKFVRGLMDNENDTTVQYFIKEGKDEDYAGNIQPPLKTRVLTLVREKDSKEEAVIDMYELDYEKPLTEKYQKRSVLAQTFILAGLLLKHTPKLTRFVFTPMKSFKQKIQIMYAMGILALLFFYMLMLAATALYTFPAYFYPPAVTGVIAALRFETPPDSASISDAKNTTPAADGDRLNLFQFLAIILSSLGLLKTSDIKERVRKMSIELVSVIRYVDTGTQRGAIKAQCGALLDHIIHKPTNYHHIYILSYSFGSIIAVDTIFQVNEPPEKLRRISGLITIGFPYELIHRHWPSYFSGRNSFTGPLFKWINIYSDTDVLSSNILDSRSVFSLPQALENKPFMSESNQSEITWLGVLLFKGFATHTSYWGSDKELDTHCFNMIVQELYLT